MFFDYVRRVVGKEKRGRDSYICSNSVLLVTLNLLNIVKNLL